jgi:hypothetical protein
LPVSVGGQPLNTTSIDGIVDHRLELRQERAGLSSGIMRTSSVAVASDGMTLLR